MTPAGVGVQNQEGFGHWVTELLQGKSVVVSIPDLDEESCDVGGLGGVFDQDLQPLRWACRHEKSRPRVGCVDARAPRPHCSAT